MPSPIAHAASGYVLGKLLPSPQSSLPKSNHNFLVFYAVFVAIVADFDFVPQLITGAKFHRGFTHSLPFAFIFSVIVALLIVWARKVNYWSIFKFTFLIYGSHLLLDYFTKGGQGMQLFLPFTDQFFQSSIFLFPQVHHSRGLFDASHWIFITFEIIYSLVIVLGTFWWQKLRRN